VYGALLELRDALAPGTEVPFTAVTALPELVTAPPEFDQEALRAALRQAFDAALTDLDASRTVEGHALAADIAQHLSRCRALALEVRARAASLVEAQRARLSERLGRLLEGAAAKLDASRLEQEVALLADRSDIAEELARLTSHFDYFAATAASEGAVGRRLEFVLQEIGREANTIASKSQDAPIAHLVVELKTEIERIREQVQNVE
jgi:uncharacterized protein (TIGR00255 family)